MTSKEIISIENFNVFYNKKQIIKNITASFEKNTIIAIIGPSGCGKSTFLSCFNKMIEEQGGNFTGKCFIDNKNVEDYKNSELRKKIGMVFQIPSPFPISIKKNLFYAPQYYGVSNKTKLNEMAKEVLIKTNLYEEVKDKLNSNAINLSGGQQQRLCIARALTVNPEVLLLDEPCSALDITNTKKIEKLLLNLKKEITILIVTHNLQQAKRIADKTMFLLNGELVEYGETKKIFENPEKEETKAYVNGIYG